MVDGREVAVDVAAQDVAEAVAEPLVAGDGPMRALAGAVGVAVVDETALEERLAHGAQRVVDHSVAERRGGDDAVLGVEDFDRLVAPRAVAATRKRALQAQDFLLEVGEEGGDAGLGPFAGSRAERSGTQGGEGGDGVEEVVGLSRHRGVLRSAWVERSGVGRGHPPARARWVFLQAPTLRPVSSRARAACS